MRRSGWIPAPEFGIRKVICHMNMYEAIFVRKSTRAFSDERLEERTLAQFRHFLSQLEPYKNIKTEFKILSCLEGEGQGKKLRPRGGVKAPYYLLLSSELKPDYLLNAGFLLQQAVLYLTAREIGTCYQGSAVFPKELLGELAYDYVMAVAFGRAKNEVYRDPKQRKRLPEKELIVWKEEPDENLRLVMEAAVAAPSAYNAQPWRFVAYENRVHLFCKKGLMFRDVLSDTRLLDMGVMMANLSTAAEEKWMDITYTRSDAVSGMSFKKNEYITTAVFRDKVF